jgi:signal transduction histidine kinase
MREVREVLGQLRDSDGAGLESLDDLVRSAQATGLVVTQDRHGDLRDQPRPTSAAAYRVAQEALTNVTRHAGECRVRVSVRRAPDAVVVEVLDDGRGASAVSGPPGHGLVGMRERVTAAGGTLSVGPEPAGGWRVRAELPLVAEEAT